MECNCINGELIKFLSKHLPLPSLTNTYNMKACTFTHILCFFIKYRRFVILLNLLYRK